MRIPLAMIFTLLRGCTGMDKVFIIDAELNGLDCLTNVFNIIAPSFIACVSKCARHNTCLSAFYLEATRTCHGCAARHMISDKGLPSLPGSRYVELPKPVGLGEPCSGAQICDSEANFMCDLTVGHCICKPGYSVYGDSQSCVLTCPFGYGSTFQRYDFSVILLGDISFADFDTVEECKAHCLSMSIIPCYSFDVDKLPPLFTNKVRCYFQTFTSPVLYSLYHEFYIRNCL